MHEVAKWSGQGQRNEFPGGALSAAADCRAFVDLKIHGQIIRALVDTCAARTVLRRYEFKDLCKRLGRQPILKTTLGLQGVTGHELKVCGKTQVLEDDVGILQVIVVDSISHPAILGRDVNRPEEATVDYSTGQLLWRGK